MHNDRSLAARQPSLFLALVAAAALALTIPAMALAQEVVHGVEILLPPGYDTPQAPSGVGQHPDEAAPSEEVIDSGGATLILVLTAAPPPLPGSERAPEIEVVGLDHIGEVVVYSPAPETMPGWRKLRGVDIKYHRNAKEPVPSRITTHSWKPSAPSWIRYHDWRSADRTRIPHAQTDSALVSQSWSSSGARFQPSRIRYHGWTRGGGDELL